VETQLLHCKCGAKREAPANLTIVSCVQCGRAMSQTSPTQVVGPPSRVRVSLATLASQLVGTLAFAFGVYWIAALHTTSAAIVGVLAAGAICVFAGGQAHRGSTNALLVCTTLDVAVAVLLLARIPPVMALVTPVLARLGLSPYWLVAIGGFAAFAAIGCVATIPEARRFAAWRTARILSAARTSRGGV
jgi:hypothetical protein